MPCLPLPSQVEQEQGTGYRLSLWARDDTLWLRTFRIQNWHGRFGNTLTLHSRWCKAWGGINDKVVVLERPAASAMMRAYSSYWNMSHAEVWLGVALGRELHAPCVRRAKV